MSLDRTNSDRAGDSLPGRWPSLTRFSRAIVMVLASFAVLGGAGWTGLQQMVRYVPRELATPPVVMTDEQRAIALAELQQELILFQQPAKDTVASTDAVSTRQPAPDADVDAWSIDLQQDQIDAWLLHHLPSERSRVVPGDVSNPRLVLEPGIATLACDFASNRFESTVSLQLEPFLVENPNQLGLLVRRARAGWLPIPLSKIVWRIVYLTRRAGLDVTCRQEEDRVVVTLTIPPATRGDNSRSGFDIMIDSVELYEHGIRLGGVRLSNTIRPNTTSASCW